MSSGSFSVCVVEATGKIRRELTVPSEPDALVRFFERLEPALVGIGLEAGPPFPMALRPSRQCRIRGRAAGDLAREGGTLGYVGQDQPHGCP
jgi:hypothetical protein